jgi:PRTRC genetic system protein E
MELFEWLSRSLEPGERLRLEIAREGESLSVLAQPVLKTAPPNWDEERQQLRAALAHPLWLTGTPDQLDRELPEALRTYADRRQTLQAAASEWDALDDAIRRAQQAVQTQRQKAAKQNTRVPPHGPAAAPEDISDTAAEGEGTANATSPAVTPPTAATNPDSLF